MDSLTDRPSDTGPLATLTLADDEAVSTAVVMAVAEASGSDPAELPPLRGAIDADALDSLFPSTRADRALCFEYAGYSVVVHGAVRVEVYPAE